MYIIFEGADGLGKSTQVKLLAEHLEQKGHEVLLTREPGTPHNDVCGSIRSVLLDKSNVITERSSLFLFLADRAQHIERVIMPALDEGKIVISDRSSLSTLIYYLASRPTMWDFSEISKEALVGMLNAAQVVSPDLCFIARGDKVFSNEQMDQRGRDRIEDKGDAFHNSVRAHFDCWANYTVPDNLWEAKFLPVVIYGMPPIPKHSAEYVAEFVQVVVGAQLINKSPFDQPGWKKEYHDVVTRWV